MPNQLYLTVEAPDEIRNAGAYDTGALMRVQSSTTEAGAFADLTGTGSTPTIAIVAATRSYVAYDPNGTGSTWYRTRYENAAATRLSDWTAAFQAGGETGGLICSVYDVEQALGGTLSANDRELVLDYIRQVTVSIEGYCGRWFVPRPLSGTATYRYTTRGGRRLRLPKGIRSVTTLNVATQDQPSTGGTYSAVASTDFVLEPSEAERDAGWPATSIVLLSTSGSQFYSAINGAEVIGGHGWAAVPHDIQGIGIRAVVRRKLGKAGSGAAVAIGPEGTEFLLPDLSGADRKTLDWYRSIPV